MTDYEKLKRAYERLQKPKYNVNAKVWRIEFYQEPHEFIVDDIKPDTYGTYAYFDKLGSGWPEDQVYPSKEALIHSQIEYWLGLANSDKSSPNSEDNSPNNDDIYERLSGLEQWAVNHDVEGMDYGQDFERRDEQLKATIEELKLRIKRLETMNEPAPRDNRKSTATLDFQDYHSALQCPHEPDGRFHRKMYRDRYLSSDRLDRLPAGLEPFYKCKHCGEFYQ